MWDTYACAADETLDINATKLKYSLGKDVVRVVKRMQAERDELERQRRELYVKIEELTGILQRQLAEARKAIHSVIREMRREHDVGDGHFTTIEVEALEAIDAAREKESK